MNVPEMIEEVKRLYSKFLLSTGINDTETMIQLQPILKEMGCEDVKLEMKVIETGDQELCIERVLTMYYLNCEVCFALYIKEKTL